MDAPQFDLARLLRCPETDDEGFQCRRSPSHAGPHRWDRCEARDRDGHRCVLPHDHPGDHEPPWYDRPATAGDTHVIGFGGTEPAAASLADRAARGCRGYGWTERSRTYRRSWPWQRQPIAGWMAKAAIPRGTLTVVFEYRATARDDRS